MWKYGRAKRDPEWRRVDLHGNDEVVEIHWQFSRFEGKINLQWLPSTAQRVYLSENFLTGSIQLESLPEKIRKLSA